jgi:serine phosphatase RsbU (regulator of sigma subunit)
VSKHLPPHFIFFRPKDIVSGDFYWALEKGEFLYLTAADCTGHGVPGAFLTMLGISFLNEINATEEMLTPGQILNSLRQKIVKELSNQGRNRDGMDISLIRLNLLTHELIWSGANNPLWLIQNNAFHSIKANKQHIGYSETPLEFTDNYLKLVPGDTIYLFTDGYADQFGGPDGKKYKYKKLRNLLIENAEKSMEEQKAILNNSFHEWKGGLEQVDDVSVIGLRIPTKSY